tara:strand:- start:4609 stop:5007 length:399 start_codon:yes stop_codon:yes gene_type:complete
MITFICEMTDNNLFRNYWIPLICRHRDFKFIFTNTKDIVCPSLDWSNVKFGKSITVWEAVRYVKTDMIYITKQNEIPTYQLMVSLMNPREGISPKIHNTDTKSSSFTVLKNNYRGESECKNITNDEVTTYLV